MSGGRRCTGMVVLVTVRPVVVSFGNRSRSDICGTQGKFRLNWNWTVLVLIAVAVAIVIVLGVVLLSRYLQNREPYASVLRLRTREKLRFFRYMATDSRVPKLVKVVPVVLALYLAMPIDIIPDFIPVLGYIDDVGVIIVALVLMVKFTPVETIHAVIERARPSETVPVDKSRD